MLEMVTRNFCNPPCVPTQATLPLLHAAVLPQLQPLSQAPAPPPVRCAPADVAARLAARDQQDIGHKRKMTGRREGTVLDPCRLVLDFTLAELGAAAGEGSLACCLISGMKGCSLLACPTSRVAQQFATPTSPVDAMRPHLLRLTPGAPQAAARALHLPPPPAARM